MYKVAGNRANFYFCIMAKDERPPQEATNMFERIIKASVKDNPKPKPKKKGKK
jgi:hypothetical protein